jgi:hypothetical protein
MRRVVSLPLAAAILFSGGSALAQIGIGGPPTLTVTPIAQGMNIINQQALKDDVVFFLYWTARVSVFDTYLYEISYDAAASATIPNVPLVTLDNTIANNFGMNDAMVKSAFPYMFQIRATQVVCQGCPPGQALTSTASTREIAIRVFRAADKYNANTASDSGWNFVIAITAPNAPMVDGVLAGDSNLRLVWEPDSTAQVATYNISYCPDIRDIYTIGTSTAISYPNAPCANPQLTSGLAATQGQAQIKGLYNNVPAAIAVQSVDINGNLGNFSPYFVGVPIPTFDFWKDYKASGGEEGGGYCFIATAAYGSYAHPVVWVLREFRDRVLKATPLGTAFVHAYYALSPPIAEEVRNDPALASIVRGALIPVAGAAILWMLFPIGGLVVLGFIARRRLRRSKLVVLAFLVASSALIAREAGAQEKVRQRPIIDSFGIGIEIKGGPYAPDMATNSPVTAFSDVYGSKPKPLFQVGVDLQLFRSFGTAGVGASFGFLQYVAKGFMALPTPNTELPMRSNDTTVFNQLPLNLVGFYRFDYLADQSGFPFVPYAKAGLAYHIWWTTNGVGDVSRYSNGSSEAVGRGGKFGYTASAGMAIMLNALEPLSAHRLFELTNIRGTYIFGEVQVSKVDGFGGSGFDLSDTTWNVGIYLEI